MASEDEEFTMLFQDFYPSLCRFLECLLGGRAPLAQDLAQESFLQLHRTAWGTLPAGEARFWLYRVARNLAINEFRKSNTRYRLFDRVVEARRPADGAAVARAGAVELPRDRRSYERVGEQGEGRHFSGAGVVARALEQA